MTKYDVIVIGAGFAGCCAAAKLSKAGLKTLLIERASDPGTKNISGGVLWGNELDDVFPNWRKEAPLERYIDRKKLAFLSADSAFAIDYQNYKWRREPHNGYSILRTKFDEYLAKKTEEQGAILITGIPIEKLAWKDGRVVGVIESGEVTYGECVIIADGANSRVTLNEGLQKHGKSRFEFHEMAIGLKEVIKLPRDKLEERFNCKNKNGVAMECVLGFLENNVMAGGFLYTNLDTISLGVVINIASLFGTGLYSYDIIERFRTHPYINDLLSDGELIEYSAHLVPEGGYKMVPKVYGNGYLITGDAAGFCFSNGLVLQGMNYAALSGKLAAETVIEAYSIGDFSEKTLKLYKRKLDSSMVMKDLKNFENVSKITWNPRMYNDYNIKYRDIIKDIVRGIWYY